MAEARNITEQAIATPQNAYRRQMVKDLSVPQRVGIVAEILRSALMDIDGGPLESWRGRLLST
jgi:hypothetical protein